MKYIPVYREIRKKFGLTPNDAMLLYYIDFMANNSTESKFKGWCYASRPTMAEELLLAESGLRKIIKKLVSLKLVKMNTKRHLKPTDLYKKTMMQIQKGTLKITPTQSEPPTQSEGVHKVKANPTQSEGLPLHKVNPILQDNIREEYESEQSARTVPKKENQKPSTLNDHSSSSSGEGSAAAGGGAVSPDPAAVIVKKILSNQQVIESWKMKYKVNGDLPEIAERFADWFIGKKCEGMGDKEIQSWVNKTGSIAFQKSFQSSWLNNLKKFNTTETPSSKVLPKSNSPYV